MRLAPGQALIRRHTERNAEAYNLYLRGWHHLNKFSPEGMAKGRECFEQAIALDANYPLAYLGLATFYYHLGFYGYVHPHEAFARCEELTGKALQLEDRIAEGHEVKGILLALDFDWQGAEREFRKALELDPDSTTVWRAYDYFWLVPMGRLDEAVETSRRALERDPVSAFVHWRLGYRYYLRRDFDLALLHYRESLEIDPNYWAVHFYRGQMALCQGRTDEAICDLETAAGGDSGSARGRVCCGQQNCRRAPVAGTIT